VAPVQPPRLAWRRLPTTGLPAIDGRSTFTGLAGTTTLVAFEAAEAEPSTFVAVARTRRRKPTSAFRTSYVRRVALLIEAQSDPSGLLPSESQRSQRYANVFGSVPLQVPVEDVRVRPTIADPVIVGSPVFIGAASGAAPATAAASTPPRPARTAAAPRAAR
jgi:hypothetical protein